MKLTTPFSIIRNAFSDIREIYDFNYITPPEKREEFWEKECAKYPTHLTCMLYEV
tara:strand:- start:311 stop:475 length:165 start_codon:yes stop_codon:yes gene_type:complete